MRINSSRFSLLDDLEDEGDEDEADESETEYDVDESDEYEEDAEEEDGEPEGDAEEDGETEEDAEASDRSSAAQQNPSTSSQTYVIGPTTSSRAADPQNTRFLNKKYQLMIRFVPLLFAISPPPHVPLVNGRDDGRSQRRLMSTTETATTMAY